MQSIRYIFENRFDVPPTHVIKAPARINIIGEHTDYNGGLSLPTAVNRYMYFAAAKNKLNCFRIYAANLDEYIELSTSCYNEQALSWSNYFVGILAELNMLNHEVSGMDIAFGGDIPIGGGMSSSSALEMGFLQVLNLMFELKLDGMEMVDISQKSNHNFLGIRGGIMDQMSILFSKKSHCLQIDFSTNNYENHLMVLKDCGLMVFDTRVQHNHQTSGYNDLVKDCLELKSALQKMYPHIFHISEVEEAALVGLKTRLPNLLWTKLKYVLEENQRVLDMVLAANLHDYKRMGELLYASHDGLQYLYKVSCRELDFVVNKTKQIKHVYGARMMGGGFGGCVLLLVDSNCHDVIAGTLQDHYKLEFGHDGTCIEIETVDGLLM